MHLLKDLCCICLKQKSYLQRLLNNCENVNYYYRLVLLFPEMISTVLYNQGAICVECSIQVDGIYKFREQCLRNSQIYIGYTSQESTVAETSEMCTDITNSKKQKLTFNDCGEIGRSYDGDNLLTECNSKDLSQNMGLVKSDNSCTMQTDKDDNDCMTEMNMNVATYCVTQLFETKDDKDITEDNYIKKEHEVTNECGGNTGIGLTAELEKSFRSVGDKHHNKTKADNTNIEEIYIKSEPVDTPAFEDEVYSTDVGNTESGITGEIYCTSSAEDMSQYNNTINMFTEEFGIKFECVGDGEYEENATGEHAGIETCINNQDESFESMFIDKIKQIKSTRTIKKNFKCDICEKTFAQLRDLIVHQRVHSGEKPFKCEQCDKAFTQIKHVKRHQLVHTREKPHKCEYCNKEFSLKESLIRHKRRHTGEKPFKCDQCDKAFTELSYLNAHKRMHSEVKPFKCEQCEKSFSLLKILIKHQLVHSGEKPFVCEQCNKAFSRKGTLIIHRLVHTGEKPYICDVCNKPFTQRKHLKRHQRLHTGERPYKCTQCTEAFTRKDALDRHKLSHQRY